MTSKPNVPQHSSRQKKKRAYQSRHRLLSIHRDATSLKERVRSALATVAAGPDVRDWPWLPNKSCGTWYLPPDPEARAPEVYFKSTDGHVGTYAVSLKRLNLPLLRLIHRTGGCFLVDSSVRKTLPDSFSRTVPLWCCALNRLALKYRAELVAGGDVDHGAWDTALHTPASVVAPEEHARMSALVDDRVELLYCSRAIVDPLEFVNAMTKPVRAWWIANGTLQHDTVGGRTSSLQIDKFSIILCCNPSYYNEGSSAKNHVHRANIKGEGATAATAVDFAGGGWYYYTPGAADDDACWGRGLTAELFWGNRDALLASSMKEGGTDATIDTLVRERLREDGDGDHARTASSADRIGGTMWIGSRSAGRPPECWGHFDAILNVMESEYPHIHRSIDDQLASDSRTCYYLQLPVAEGKKDKTQLERWMPVGIIFLMQHLQRKRRVLVHCAQGRDRSVAVALAFVALFCPPVYPLRLCPSFEAININCLAVSAGCDNTKEHILYLRSGLPSFVVDALLKENGRDLFLKWMHEQLKTPSNKPFADKNDLRIALHLLRQDREVADPTRSTMQKLNRFFMSSVMYRSVDST